MKTNEITLNLESQTPVAVPPAAPLVTLPPPAAAPVVVMTMSPPAPVIPMAAKPRKGGKKNKTPALTAKP